MSENAKGYNCKTCGERHDFPAYVYAHWGEMLTHECDKCGAKHRILSGRATQVKRGKAAALKREPSK